MFYQESTPTTPKIDIIMSRLDEVYYDYAKCEYDDCQNLAAYHCCDSASKFCGRIVCEKHAKDSKSTPSD